MQEVRALVVDDFKPWRDFARSTLETIPGLLIVGEASDGLEAVQKAEELQPDLVVLDVGLPKLNGIEAARQIAGTCRTSKIIFLTENHSHDVADEASQVGAAAYVVKSHAEKQLIPALKSALNGRLAV